MATPWWREVGNRIRDLVGARERQREQRPTPRPAPRGRPVPFNYASWKEREGAQPTPQQRFFAMRQQRPAYVRPGAQPQREIIDRAALGRALAPAERWYREAAARVGAGGGGRYTPVQVGRPEVGERLAAAVPRIGAGLAEAAQAIQERGLLAGAPGVARAAGAFVSPVPGMIGAGTATVADVAENLKRLRILGSPLPGRIAAAAGEAGGAVGGGLLQAAAVPAQEVERAIGGAAVGIEAAKQAAAQGLPLPEQARVAGAGFQLGREALGPVAYSVAGEQLAQAARAIGGPESGTLAPMFQTPAPAGIQRAQQARQLAAQGATPEEIAAQAGQPIMEAAGQVLLDPLNFLSVGATARRQAGEANAARRYFVEPDARSYDEIRDALKAGGNPRPAAGPLESVANVINPRTQAGRAELLIEDTSDVVTILSSQAENPEQRLDVVRNLINLGDPDRAIADTARAALADFGSIPESQAGKQATVFLRELATNPETGAVDPGIIARTIRQAETPEAATEALVRKMESAADAFYQVKRGAQGGVTGTGFLQQNPIKKFQNGINGVIARYFHLGYSLSYAHRNFAANLLHGLVDGNHSFASADRMAAWTERFGYQTRAATRAIGGAAGMKAGETIQGARRFRPITLREAYGTLLKKESWKQGPSLALGQAFEQWEGGRVWQRATETVWNRSWQYGRAIPGSPVIDALPRDLRNYVLGRVSGAMDTRELQSIITDLRGRRAVEAWRVPDNNLTAALQEINPGLADAVTDAGRLADSPEDFARRLDELLTNTDQHTASALADDTPLLTQADPAADDVTLISQTEGPHVATETGQRIAAGRQQRDAARVIAWTRLEDIPEQARQVAQQVGDWVGARIVETYNAADEATARWMSAREISFDEAEQIKANLWQQFAQQRDAQYAQVIGQLGPDARPLLVLRQADDATIAQAAMTKQKAAAVWQRYRAGEIPYDAAKLEVENLWNLHNRYATTQYDQAWRLLGGDPNRGPLARIGVEPIQRSSAVLRRELAASALDAGIPGIRLKPDGSIAPHPRLLNTINKDLEAAGLQRVRRLSDMDAPQMEAATSAMRRRAAGEAIAAPPGAGTVQPAPAVEAAPAAQPEPPQRVIAEIADSLDAAPPTRATLSAEASARTEPLLRQIRDGIAAVEEPGRLDARTLQQVENWLKSLTPRMNEAKAIAARVGSMDRDFTLLNYGDRRLSDTVMGYGMMYSYWPSRTVVNWARRVGNNPALIARYMRYKQAQHEMNKDLPEWWREQIAINPFGLLQNPLYMNIEQTLNPLYQVVNDFEDRDRGAKQIADLQDRRAEALKAGRKAEVAQIDQEIKFYKLGTTMQAVGNVGFGSVWMPLQMVYALSLANRGDQEGAQAWASYLGTPTRTLHYATSLLRQAGVGGIPAGGIVLEPWLWTPGTMFQGGDKWERRRIGKSLYDMYRDGTISYEQMVDSAWSQRGDVWNEATQRATVQRAPGAVAGYLLGQGFKTRQAYEIDIDRASDEFSEIMDRLPTLTPEQKSAEFDAFYGKYPWYGAVQMSKKKDVERDIALAWDTLRRLPPGNDRKKIIEAAHMDEDLLSRFYDDADVDLNGWNTTDRNRFMASVLDIAAVLKVPNTMTKDAWKKVQQRNRSMWADLNKKWPDYEEKNNEYWRIVVTNGEDAGKVYLQSNPDLLEAWSYKTKRITTDPLLFAYYGDQTDLEKAATNDLYTELDRRFPGARQGEQLYYEAKDAGASDERLQAMVDRYNLSDYWDFKRIGKEFIKTYPPQAPSGAPPRPAQLRPEAEPISPTQKAIQAAVRPPTAAGEPTFEAGIPGKTPTVAEQQRLLSQLNWGGEVPVTAPPAPTPRAPGLAAPPVTTLPRAAPPQVEQWRDLIETNAQTAGIDPRVLATVMYIESRGKSEATSNKGAVGLMQVMPRESGKAFADRPTAEELKDPAFNVEYGTGILKNYIDYFGGDVRKGLAAYYAGPGYVKREGTEGKSSQEYLTAFDKAWAELWGGAPSTQAAPVGPAAAPTPTGPTAQPYAQRMFAAAGDTLAWTYAHGTQKELARELTNRLYDEADKRFPGAREASEEYSAMKDAGARAADLKAYRESHAGLTDYWDFTSAGRQFVKENELLPGGSQAKLNAYLDAMLGGPGGLTGPLALTRTRMGGGEGGGFHLGPRNRRYEYKISDEAWDNLPAWMRQRMGGDKPYVTPLYGEGKRYTTYHRGGGHGKGGRGRVSSYVLRKMTPALLAQLRAFFAGGPALEEGALRELQALGIGNAESLRAIFTAPGPTPIPSGKSNSRSRPTFWRAF